MITCITILCLFIAVDSYLGAGGILVCRFYMLRVLQVVESLFFFSAAWPGG